MKKILFFEDYSGLQIMSLRRHVRDATVIYFYGQGHSRLDFRAIRKKFAFVVLQILNSHTKIQNISQELLSEHIWLINSESLRIVENTVALVEKSDLYRLAVKLVGDRQILKYYKMGLARYIPKKVLFWRVAETLQREHNCLHVVPSGERLWGLMDDFIVSVKAKSAFIINHGIICKLERLIAKTFLSLGLLFVPLGFFLSCLKSRKISKKKERYEVRMPVIWGFRDGDGNLDGMKRPHDDGYLYGAGVDPGDIIHVFGDWKIPASVKRRYKRIMTEKGYSWIDQKEYVVDRSFMKEVAHVSKIVFSGLVRSRLNLREPAVLIKITHYLVYHLLKKKLELENIDYNVEFIRDDYNAKHVIATLLCNQEKRQTVGIQHVHIPHTAPNLCYVHLDKYIVYGDMFVNPFTLYWKGLKLEKTGRENIDWVVNLINDQEKTTALQDKLSHFYSDRKHNAVIILPSGAERNKISQWREMFNALKELRDSDIDVNVFLRFRKEKDLKEYDHLKQFESLTKWDERINIDHNNFSTYELLVLCDLVIANTASFAINEAIVINKRVFSFDFIGFAKYYFPDYGNDFILYTKNDLLRVFRGFTNNFADLDCDWEKLKRDCNYHHDGKNHDRIRKVVVDTIKEVHARR